MNAPATAGGSTKARLLRRVPTGWLVVAALLLLLQGPVGAIQTLAERAYDIGVSLLGGEAIVRGVLRQAAPLAGAAACVAFAVRAGWLRFESLWSVVACTAILYASAAIGAEFDRRGRPPHQEGDRATESAFPAEVPLAAAVGELASWRSLTELYPLGPQSPSAPRVVIFSGPNRPGGVLNLAVLGVEKLLGYLLIYRPRLFLAAVIAGGFVGWRWHARLERFAERGRLLLPPKRRGEIEKRAA